MHRVDCPDFQRIAAANPERVVDCALRALPRGRAVVMPGLFNRLIGRLMQMPIAQPFVRALIRQERTLSS